VDDASKLKGLFETIQRLNGEGKLLAYHDRSDGGLLATLCEMAFASHIGLDVSLDALKAMRSARCSTRSWAPWCGAQQGCERDTESLQ